MNLVFPALKNPNGRLTVRYGIPTPQRRQSRNPCHAPGRGCALPATPHGIPYVGTAPCPAGSRAVTRRHTLYQQTRARKPRRWSHRTRNWAPVVAATLNPERDAVIAAALSKASYTCETEVPHKQRSLRMTCGDSGPSGYGAAGGVVLEWHVRSVTAQLQSGYPPRLPAPTPPCCPTNGSHLTSIAVSEYQA